MQDSDLSLHSALICYEWPRSLKPFSPLTCVEDGGLAVILSQYCEFTSLSLSSLHLRKSLRFSLFPFLFLFSRGYLPLNSLVGMRRSLERFRNTRPGTVETENSVAGDCGFDVVQKFDCL